MRDETAPDQNSIVCLRPSPSIYHPVKYTGKYAKTIAMYPPSLMPPSCNGQATWLNRDGKSFLQYNQNQLLLPKTNQFLALLRIQLESERTDMDGFRIEDEFFTGILREKAQIKNVTSMDKVVERKIKSLTFSNKEDGFKEANIERSLLLLRQRL